MSQALLVAPILVPLVFAIAGALGWGRARFQRAIGIAGALLTTVVGLLVALPSAIGYNLMTNRIRELQVQSDNFAQEFVASVQRVFLRDPHY